MTANLSFRAVLRGHRTTPAAVEAAYETWLVATDGAEEVQRLNSPARAGASFRAGAGTADGGVSVSATADGDHAVVAVDASEPLPEGLQLRAPALMIALLEALELADAGVKVTAHAESAGESHIHTLVEYICSPDRRLPVVVVTENSREASEAWRERADAIARTFAGAAIVVALASAPSRRLRTALGGYLAVWGGAVRTYMPGISLDMDRQRAYESAPVLPAYRTGDLERMLALLSRSVARLAFAQTAPRSREPDAQAVPAARAPVAQDVSIELTAALTRLELVEGAIDRLSRDLGEAQTRLDDAVARLVEENLLPAETDTAADGTVIQSCSDAVLLADEELEGLVIGGDAYAGAERLDVHRKASVWARTAWRTLRALDAYAAARQGEHPPNNFLDYCRRGDGPVISARTVALAESDTIRNGQQYRRHRVFEVDPAVSTDGRIYMEAHVRIDSGKHPAPRLYFHDDTGGSTGRVHVGYLGEHLHSPQTN